MQILKRPILDKSGVERLEEKGISLPSYTRSDSIGKPSVSDTMNVVSETEPDSIWLEHGEGIESGDSTKLPVLLGSEEEEDSLITVSPSSTWPPVLENIVIHDDVDVAGDDSVPARVALDTGDSFRRKVAKMNKEWIFVAINFVIELLSAAFDQLSSVHKPRYALIAMLMSFVAALICIIELAYKAGKERVIWRWESNKLPWIYYPPPSNKPFGTFPEIIGFICAILQSISSAIVYSFYLRHADYPIKISFWPLVFALGLLCSKFMQNPDKKATFRRD